MNLEPGFEEADADLTAVEDGVMGGVGVAVMVIVGGCAEEVVFEKEETICGDVSRELMRESTAFSV